MIYGDISYLYFAVFESRYFVSNFKITYKRLSVSEVVAKPVEAERF